MILEKTVANNKVAIMDQSEYQKSYNEMIAKYEAIKSEYERVSGMITDRKGRRKICKQFIDGLKHVEGFSKDFDEELWSTLLDYAIVYTKDSIAFIFKNGFEVKV